MAADLSPQCCYFAWFWESFVRRKEFIIAIPQHVGGHHCWEHCLSVDSLGRLETGWHLRHRAFLLHIFISEYRRVWWLLTGSFCGSPRLGDGFTDFVPWSMGCNYIFTIGSPSYNVQRMLTICFNTSPAGRYSSWLLSVPIFIDIFLSRPEPWGSAQTWAPLKGYFDRNHFSSEPV